MHQKQTEEFEASMRKLSEQASGPFHQDSWEKMEQLLERKKKKRLAIFPWIHGILLFAIAISVIGFNYFNNPSISNTSSSNQIESTTKLSSTIGSNQTNSDKTQDGQTESPVNNQQDLPHSSQQSSTTNINSPTIHNITSSNTISSKQSNFSRSTKPQSTNSITNNTNANDQQLQSKIQSTSITHVITNVYAPITDTITNSEHSAIYPAWIQIPAIHIIQSNIASDIKDIHWKDIPKPDASKQVKIDKKHTEQFAFFGLYGLEHSGIYKRQIGAAQHIYGGSIGYRFHNNWRIILGAQQSIKSYPAEKEDYSFAYSSYFADKKIPSIYGRCKVFDLYVGSQYLIQLTSSNNLILNTSLHSMRMQSEDYALTYITPTGSSKERLLEYNTKKWNWSSTLRLGVGYEYHLNNRWQISGMPYFNLPIYGAGEGKINFYSLGMEVKLGFKL